MGKGPSIYGILRFFRQFRPVKFLFLTQFYHNQKSLLPFCPHTQKECFGKRDKKKGKIWSTFKLYTKVEVSKWTAP